MSAEKIKRQNREFASKKEYDLHNAIQDIDKIAKEFGLDYFNTEFHPVSADAMYEAAAYSIPGRFNHWTFGKDYYTEKTKYNYDFGKIYEVVFNTDPALAFFMDNNTMPENKLIIGHVLAHVDFFKNNAAFKDTSRKMPDSARRLSRDLNKYRYEHGEIDVEEFLDSVMSIEFYVDPDAEKKPVKEEKKAKNTEYRSQFADIFEIGEKPAKKEEKKIIKKLPDGNERDIMLFIAQNSSLLEDWQRDVMLRMRKEMIYFLPQMKTQIMNEGWASFWHKRILRKLGALNKLNPGEDINWMRVDSGVVVPNPRRINPYFVGCRIWEDIDRKFKGEERIDGKIEKDMWGDPVNPAVFKGDENYDIFRIRKQTPNDQEFLRNYLTDPLIDELLLSYFTLEEEDIKDMQKTRKKVKQIFINLRDNSGMPDIVIPAESWSRTGKQCLNLLHNWDGRDLDLDWTERTLKSMRRLIGDIRLETRTKDEKIVLSCEGENGEISKDSAKIT